MIAQRLTVPLVATMVAPMVALARGWTSGALGRFLSGAQQSMRER